MHVIVRVRLAWRIGRKMLVLVVLIMHMLVRVRHWLVGMLMLVLLRQVEPHAESHEPARQPECRPG